MTDGFLVGEVFAVDNVYADAVETGESIGEVFFCYFGTEKDVAGIDAVASLLDELDNVEAIFGLYDFRHFLGVVEVECDGSKLGHELSATHESHFATTGCATGVLGVEDCEN